MDINATLFGQMITFLLFVWFTMKFVWPLVQKALDEREAKIADGLAAAERGHHDLALAQEKAKGQLREAKEQASELLDGARKQADRLVEQAKEEADEQAKRILERAQEEIVQMERASRDKLRSHVGQLAVLGAQKILSRTVDESMHEELLQKLVEEL